MTGILKPAVLVSAIDYSVLVGYPAAEKYLGFDGHGGRVDRRPTRPSRGRQAVAGEGRTSRLTWLNGGLPRGIADAASRIFRIMIMGVVAPVRELVR